MDYIDFKIKYTADELQEYEQAYYFRKYFNMFKGLPGIIMIIVIGYFAVIAYQNGIQSVNKLALVVFGILIFSFFIVLARVIHSKLTYQKRYEGKEILEKETRVVLSINGEYPDDLGETPVYEEAFDFFESKNLLIIEVGNENVRRALIIPEHYCSSPKIKEFIRDCGARMVQNRKDNAKRKKKK